jgi:lysophospholipid acyltransferase (LPLAT)-like uncharacterized protein
MSAWTKLRWNAVGILGRAVLRIWGISCRTRVLGEEEYLRLRKENKPVIFLTWHGRLLIIPYFFRNRGVSALVSPSRDGEILARIGSRWGYRVYRGSGSHSMVRAWLEMKKELREGGELIIIPDGPRGPNRELKPGCLKLAQETGALLVPFSFSASRRKFLKTWDSFLFYYPFSRIVAVYGDPIAVDPVLDEEGLERERRRVERLLKELDSLADRQFEKTAGVSA